jgi:hypothetical protein
MIDINTCQPGQQLIRRDGLRAEYIGLNIGDTLVYRHRVMVRYHALVIAEKHYMDNGKFLSAMTDYEGDIIEILPMPTTEDGNANPIGEGPSDAPAYKWHAKISDDRVDASAGFWAVYQGEA